MNRSAFASACTLLFCSAVAVSAFAQAKPAAPTTPAPAARAKFATPVKGEAIVQVIPSPPKYVGNDIVTVYKIKNMAPGPIAMLKIDQYWYDKGKMVSTATERYRQPFQPGEVIEMTTRAPKPAASGGALQNNATFSHANGKITAKPVKKFD
jgi:hypothetical protein